MKLYGIEVPRPRWALGSGLMARPHRPKLCLKLPSKNTSFGPRLLNYARHKTSQTISETLSGRTIGCSGNITTEQIHLSWNQVPRP